MNLRKQIGWLLATPFIIFGLLNAATHLAPVYWSMLKVLGALLVSA